MRVIDLRSDTVTKPGLEMRQAMVEAEVGDDVYGEDPTVVRLEEEIAEVTGFEASLFVPTGTMGNQIALHLLGRPGTEVVCTEKSHVVDYELAAMAVLSGLLPRTVRTADGLLTPNAVAGAVAPDVVYRAPSTVLVVENTANMAGGRVYSAERLAEVIEAGRAAGLRVHLDGARLWNAAVALGASPATLTVGFDSAMVGLSKGLGAPVGSMFCCDENLVEEARRVRKRFGGGMRQVGMLAAAGRFALRRNMDRLEEDHEKARRLAESLAALPGLAIDASEVETNIVVAEVKSDFMTAPELAKKLEGVGVLAGAIDPKQIRFVTHLDVSFDAIDEAIERIVRLS